MTSLFILLLILVLALAIFRDLDELEGKINETLESVRALTRAREIIIYAYGIPTEGQMFLKVNQKLPLSIAIKDAFGNAAKVDGVPSWALDNPALAALVVAADGMSAELQPAGQVGTFKVQVSADADLGPGVTTILGELEIELLPGDAVTVEVSAGTPV